VARGSKRSSSFCMSGWSCIERHYGFFVLGRCLNQMMSSFSLLLCDEIPGSSKGPWVFGSAKCIIL
jgi:hypothetical protein